MKKIGVAALVLFGIAMVSAGSARTVWADKDIGCGLGTQLWEGKEGLVFKVIGATTNGTFGNQTFGITSGTLGCSQDGVITADARLRMFASANMDNLARDMASGHGETLDAFATLMKVTPQDKPAFMQLTREHFTDLFAADDVTAGQMLAALNTVLAADPTLSVYAKS